MQSTPSPKVLDYKQKPDLDSFLFKKDYYIDVRDMAGTWVVGKIIDANLEEMVLKIRMEGTKQESVRIF
jgi:hypothetical protein